MNIAIVDDEQNEIDIITALIKEYCAVNNIPLSLDIFRCGEDYLESYRPFSYTATFMDIYITGMTGVETTREILERDRRAVIIFLTSSDEYMPEAFSMHVYDYIAKPAAKDRIFKVMDDLMMLNTNTSAPMLSFTCGKDDYSLPLSDIVYVQTADKNYIEIIDCRDKVYQTRMTISEISQKLEEDPCFLPILRGVLVNMDYIKQIDGSNCLLTTGKSLPITIRNARKLESTWQNYVFDSIRADRRKRRSKK